MLHICNNCRIGKFCITPKNWDKPRASTATPWMVVYWFYDDNTGKKKQRRLRGMNSVDTLAGRQAATRALIQDELKELKIKGYNPITKKYICPTAGEDSPVSKMSSFSEALKFGLTKEETTAKHLTDTTRYVNNIIKSAKAISLNEIPISEVELKDLMRIFDHLKATKDNWSANQNNVHRKALIKLFGTLKLYGAVIANFPEDLPVKMEVKKFRKTLDKKKLKDIFDHLKKSNYNFWRFSNIFFHSGCRESELLNVQAKHVDIKNREFLITVNKGKDPREDLRAITLNALPYWKEIMAKVKSPDDFIFSKKLIPGSTHINPIQIPRRWRNQVKIPFEVEADFYSLKHLYLDKVSEKVGLKMAQKAAGHSNVDTTKKFYTINEKRREIKTSKAMRISL